MRILVIEDNVLHQDAAISQLSCDHAVTVIGTISEAYSIMNHGFNRPLAELMFWEEKKCCLMSYDKSDRRECWDRCKQTCAVGGFDVLLTDLFLPYTIANYILEDRQNDPEVAKELVSSNPLGLSFSLEMLSRGTLEHVAINSDIASHENIFADMLFGCSNPLLLRNGGKLLWTKHLLGYSQLEQGPDANLKDWKLTLSELMSEA